MTGVNDVIQHVGENAYVEYTRKLVDYFSEIDDEEVISIPRVNEMTFKSPNLYSRIKRGYSGVSMMIASSRQMIDIDRLYGEITRNCL